MDRIARTTVEYDGNSYTVEVHVSAVHIVQALARRAARSKKGIATALQGGVKVRMTKGDKS